MVLIIVEAWKQEQAEFCSVELRKLKTGIMNALNDSTPDFHDSSSNSPTALAFYYTRNLRYPFCFFDQLEEIEHVFRTAESLYKQELDRGTGVVKAGDVRNLAIELLAYERQMVELRETVKKDLTRLNELVKSAQKHAPSDMLCQVILPYVYRNIPANNNAQRRVIRIVEAEALRAGLSQKSIQLSSIRHRRETIDWLTTQENLYLQVCSYLL